MNTLKLPLASIDGMIVGSDGVRIADLSALQAGWIATGNAAEIVRRVNIHDELVDALRFYMENALDGYGNSLSGRAASILAKAERVADAKGDK